VVSHNIWLTFLFTEIFAELEVFRGRMDLSGGSRLGMICVVGEDDADGREKTGLPLYRENCGYVIGSTEAITDSVS
jgi:hypothetical protein